MAVGLKGRVAEWTPCSRTRAVGPGLKHFLGRSEELTLRHVGGAGDGSAAQLGGQGLPGPSVCMENMGLLPRFKTKTETVPQFPSELLPCAFGGLGGCAEAPFLSLASFPAPVWGALGCPLPFVASVPSTPFPATCVVAHGTSGVLGFRAPAPEGHAPGEAGTPGGCDRRALVGRRGTRGGRAPRRRRCTGCVAGVCRGRARVSPQPRPLSLLTTVSGQQVLATASPIVRGLLSLNVFPVLFKNSGAFCVTCLRTFFALFSTGHLTAFPPVSIIKRGISSRPESGAQKEQGAFP